MKHLAMPVVLGVFVFMVLTNWYFSYAILQLPGVRINAWAVVFPFISVIYIVFSLLAASMLHCKHNWGLRLASIMLLFGAFMALLSFGLTFRLFPFVQTTLVFLLIANFLTVMLIGFWYVFVLRKHE